MLFLAFGRQHPPQDVHTQQNIFVAEACIQRRTDSGLFSLQHSKCSMVVLSRGQESPVALFLAERHRSSLSLLSPVQYIYSLNISAELRPQPRLLALFTTRPGDMRESLKWQKLRNIWMATPSAGCVQQSQFFVHIDAVHERTI